MPTVQLPLPTAQLHRNRQLFSDYYLNLTLPQNPEWRLLARTGRKSQTMSCTTAVRRGKRIPIRNEEIAIVEGNGSGVDVGSQS